jgi:O-antigen ligase
MTNPRLSKFMDIAVLSMAASSLVFSSSLYEQYQLAKAACLAVLLIPALACLLMSGDALKINFTAVVFLVFLFYSACRLLFSPYNPQYYYSLTLTVPAMFLVSRATAGNHKKYLVLLNALVFVSALYGLYQSLRGMQRPYSFFGNPVFFGEFMMMGLPFIFASFFLFKSNRLFFSLNAALTLACAGLAGSRGAFVSIAVSCGLLLYLLIASGAVKPGLKPGLNPYAAVFLLILLASFLMPGMRGSAKSNLDRAAGLFSGSDQSVSGRLLMLKTALKITGRNPAFGSGAGAFKYFFQKYQAETTGSSSRSMFINTSYAHDDYAQIAAESGLSGLVLFLVFFLSLFHYFEKRAYSLSPENRVFSFALVSVLAGTLAECFFNFPMMILPSSMLFWLYAGMLHNMLSERDADAAVLPRAAAGLITSAAVAAVIAAVLMRPLGLVSDAYLQYGIRHAGTGPDGDRKFITALKCDPHNYYNYFYLAGYYSEAGEYRKASDAYMAALKLNPYAADLLYDEGAMCVKLKDYNKAADYFGQSLSLYPGFAYARLALGKTLISLKRDSEGSSELAIAQKIDPGIIRRDIGPQLMKFGEMTQ